MKAWLIRGLILALLAFIVLGPLANLVLWAAAEQWISLQPLVAGTVLAAGVQAARHALVSS
jgi:hypothetical protein